MGSRILLADDSITIQKVVNLTFADEGIEVVAVSNGDLAERRLNEVQPDLVLADIFMPGKNGYELCEAIKQNSQFRNVPVVLLVGAFEPFDQAEARRVRADAHLTKPFESRTLVETVRRLISASGRTNTGPIAPMPSPGDGREEMREADPPPRLNTATAPKLDLSEMMVKPSFSPVTSPTRKTGELASSSPDEGSQDFDLGVVDMPAREAVNATLTDASERFEPTELSSIGEFAPVDMTAPSGHDEQDMILDFDRSEPSESRAPVSTLYFETEASALLEVDVSGVGEGAEWSTPDNLNTRALEMPSINEAWQSSSNTAPLNGQARDLRPHNQAAFAASEGSTETACATLLAVDEPLADVFDETVSAGMLPFSHDSLDIQFTDPKVTVSSAAGSTQFDLIDTREDPSSQASLAVEDSTEWGEVQGAEGTLRLIDQANADAGSLPDSQSASAEVADILDWASPSADNYSTAQLDSVLMPIDTAEQLPENNAGNDTQQADNTQEASFESAKFWPEEEARFTAIDIEAFPVEDAEDPHAAPDRLGGADTGFSLSSVAPEQPSASVEVPAANATSSVPSNDGAPASGELSSAAIEEIVRRVVAEMSESVVREVAWEVVPDCVERVIDQLTRESLSKRA
ncbi:MAG: response regulator [Acidobacteriota bacterium]